MLARVANNLFWMGRYIERSEHVARYLNVNYFSSLDAPNELSQSRQFVLRSMLFMASDAVTDPNVQLDEGQVLFDIALNKEKPDSIINYLQNARENANSARDLSSTELYESLNKFYHYTLNYSPEKFMKSGLYEFTVHVAESTSLPIYIYNIPSRSVVDMDMKTLERLAKIENISGIKDASCDLERPGQVVDLIGKNFCQLSGEDETVLPFLEKGGVGCISVTANVAPKLCSELHEVWAKQDTKTLEEIDAGLQSLHKAMFCETSPGPVKFALSLLGHCSPDMRLPLVEIAEESKQIVKDAMIKAGLISK